jgi:hypothetical protein
MPYKICYDINFRLIYLCLVKNPEGKRPLGRPRRRWVENIKMDLTEIEWDGLD